MPDNSYIVNDKGILSGYKNGSLGVNNSYIELSNDVIVKYKANCIDSCNVACNGCMNSCETGCGVECGDGCVGSCKNGCVFTEDGEITCSTCGTACIGSCYSACRDCGGCSGRCDSSAAGNENTQIDDTSSTTATSKCVGCGGSCIANATGNVSSIINGR